MKRTSFSITLVFFSALFQTILPALLSVAWLTSLTACALLERSPHSGYGQGSNYRSALVDEGLDYRDDRQTYFREQAADEMGYNGAPELDESQQQALGMRMRLKEAERAIVGKKEREQYFRHKPLMQSDRERMEFMKIPTFEARNRWLAARGISAVNPHHPSEIQTIIEQNDVTLGMSRQAVRESWGEPELVEVAGNPIYGNERWKYLEEVSSPEGYQTEARIIYFESGRVAGWEKQ